MSYIGNLGRGLLVAAVLAIGSSATAPALADHVGHEIDALNVKWVAAFKAKDIATIESLLAPNALLLSPGAPAVQGAKAVAETWRGWSELKGVELTFGALRVEASGDMAWDYGTYSFAFDGDKGRVTDKGKYIVVWKKIDGAWKVAADIYNNNGSE